MSVTKDFYVYQTKVNHVEIAFVQAPLGGAGAVQIMEQLIAGGVEEIIAAGCCGALVEDTEGSFFCPYSGAQTGRDVLSLFAAVTGDCIGCCACQSNMRRFGEGGIKL